MKLLHIIGSVDQRGGGTVEVILRLSEATRNSMQHEIASLDSPDAEFVKSFPVPTHALGNLRGERAGWLKPLARYGYAPRVIPWLRQHVGDYDCVVVHGLWNYSKFAASRVLPGGKVPYVVFPHGMLDPWFQQKYPLKRIGKQLSWWICEGPLMANARAALFTAEEERERARGAFLGYRYKERIVELGAEEPPAEAGQEDAFYRAVPTLQGRKFLLYLSRIHPKKGCDLLLEAFAELAPRHPELDLVMAGPDQVNLQARLEKFAEERGIAHRVHWPGMLTGATKWGAYRAAEAFILPSHQENFGIVVVEAAACSTPVLITNKVNIWREIQQDGAGLAENDDQAGVTRLLSRFLALSEEERAAMKRSARQCYETRFNMETAGRRFEEAIDEAVRTQ